MLPAEYILYDVLRQANENAICGHFCYCLDLLLFISAQQSIATLTWFPFSYHYKETALRQIANM